MFLRSGFWSSSVCGHRRAALNDMTGRVEGSRLITIAAMVLGALWMMQGIISVRGTGDDWKIFWNAAHYVGTPQLLSSAHFAYMPGAAWGLWLLAGLSRPASYFVYSGFMLCCGFFSALLAARIYRVPAVMTCLMLLWWWPLTIAVCLGQNTPMLLLLVMLVAYSFERRNEFLLGVSVGLSLYKPTIGIPLLVFLVAFKQWKATAIVGLSLVFWYLLSAGAVHDLFWPRPYLHMLSALYSYDRVVDGDYAIGLPGIMIHAGLVPLVGWIIGICLLIAMATLLPRMGRLEAASMMPAIALTSAGHAYGYDALLMLPVLWLLVSRKTSQMICLVVASYIIAPFYLASRAAHFDALALPVIGITVGWAIWLLRGNQTAEIGPSAMSA
jgi:hypothetical protein